MVHAYGGTSNAHAVAEASARAHAIAEADAAAEARMQTYRDELKDMNAQLGAPLPPSAEYVVPAETRHDAGEDKRHFDPDDDPTTGVFICTFRGNVPRRNTVPGSFVKKSDCMQKKAGGGWELRSSYNRKFRQLARAPALPPSRACVRACARACAPACLCARVPTCPRARPFTYIPPPLPSHAPNAGHIRDALKEGMKNCLLHAAGDRLTDPTVDHAKGGMTLLKDLDTAVPCPALCSRPALGALRPPR